MHFSAFISYGSPDEVFACQLTSDLRGRGVKCWFYPDNATPGERTQKEIIEERRSADRVIIVCSYQSLIQPGVLSELGDQIREDPEKLIPVSLDTVWTVPGFRVQLGDRDLKPFLIDRNYVSFTDESLYESSLERLLRVLDRELADPESSGDDTSGVWSHALDRRVAAIAHLLKLRRDAKDLAFVPQILDELARVFILKYRFLSAEDADRPRAYLKLLTALRADVRQNPAFQAEVRAQGWDIQDISKYFAEVGNLVNRRDRSPDAIGLVEDRLSRLYTLLQGLVAEDIRPFEASVQIALSEDEGDCLEYKSSLRYNLRTKQVDKQMELEVIKTLAGFANNRGGTLYVGVGDDRSVVGVKPDLGTFGTSTNPEDAFRRHFEQLVDRDLGLVSHQIIEEPIWAELEGEKVFAVSVKAAAAPIFVKRGGDGDFYLRKGARTVQLGPQQFFEYFRARWLESREAPSLFAPAIATG